MGLAGYGAPDAFVGGIVWDTTGYLRARIVPYLYNFV